VSDFAWEKELCQIQAFDAKRFAKRNSLKPHPKSCDLGWTFECIGFQKSREIKKESLPIENWQSFSSFTVETIKDSW
jgi:hypothetical protein